MNISILPLFLSISLYLSANPLDIDQYWLTNKQLWDNLDCVKIQPRLGLYTKIEVDQIAHYSQCSQQLEQQIHFNERLQQKFESTSVLQELKLQNLLIRIAHAFNESLVHRKKHNFPLAFESINSSLGMIESYQALLEDKQLKYFRTPESLLSTAYYHKAKIHRMLAGYQLDHLDDVQLQHCEECYLKALEICPDNAVIHSSLGFLYNDMGRDQEAHIHHLMANRLQPEFPDFLHGLGYCMYLIEQKKGEELDFENLEKVNQIYDEAVALFEEYKTENSRIFLDRGKLKLLMGKNKEALKEFRKGLKIDPHHKLLTNEIKTITDTSIVDSQNAPDRRVAFDKFLKECASYVKKKPKIFICYAWYCQDYNSCNLEHDQWIEQFAKDLETAGFDVLFDRWITRKGHEKMDFVEKIMTDEADYIVVVGSKLFLEKYNDISMIKNEREKVLRIEVRLLNHLIGFNQMQSNKVIPVLIEGLAEESLPPLLRIKNLVDFTLNEYALEMSEMIRDLHGIDQRDPYFKQLMDNLK